MILAGLGQSTLEPASDAARTIADLWWLLFAVSLVVVTVVTLLVVLVVLRGRGQRPASTPDPQMPESRGGMRLIVLGGVVIPALVLFGLLVATIVALPSTSAPAAGSAPLTVEVLGRQWFWVVRYPGREVVTANEIHIPAGTDVELDVATKDVIHSFWVPRLNRKIDMIPGHPNRILLHADTPGVYRGQCAEFCGLEHALMAFEVVADPAAEFASWLAGQRADTRAPAGDEAANGARAFADSGCGGCHRIAGTDAQGDFGPDLTHLASRRTIAALTLPNDPASLRRWIRDPQDVKPGNLMPAVEVSDDDLDAIVAYLGTLK